MIEEIKTNMMNAMDTVAEAEGLRSRGREFTGSHGLTIYRDEGNTIEVEVSIIVRKLRLTK